MIKYLEGNIFKSPARVLVNTVNTVGVMGKGIALEFKRRYPAMYGFYREECKKGRFKVDQLMIWREADHEILLFPTKEDWKKPSKIEYIEKGLRTLADNCNERGIDSLAMPRLGCGNGGLKWEQVRLLIEKYLGGIPIDIYVYVGGREIKEKNESEKIISRNMSYEGILDDIACKYSIIPWQSRGENYTVRWKEGVGLLFEIDDTIEEYSKEEIDRGWSAIREKNIISVKKIEDKTRRFYEFMTEHDYLSRVRILEKNELVEGYQYNAGSEWLYAAGL